MHRPQGVLGAVAILLLLPLCAVGVAAQEDGGMTWSAEECGACHTDLVASFSNNPHSVLDDNAALLPEGSGSSCTSCHGDAARHIEEGGGVGNIFNFGDQHLASTRVEACQECHGNAHPRFLSSPHARAGMDCTSCHGMHGEDVEPPMLKGDLHTADGWPSDQVSESSASCYECHADVFDQFAFNERHRLQEDILECVSCHDPHAPATRTMLGGFKQQQCIECHQDKGGPWVFEHPAQRVEGCVACHTPHGSPNRHLLKFQNVAELCYSCHAAVPGFHARFTLESQCTNCHSTIHGSNFDPFFLK